MRRNVRFAKKFKSLAIFGQLKFIKTEEMKNANGKLTLAVVAAVVAVVDDEHAVLDYRLL